MANRWGFCFKMRERHFSFLVIGDGKSTMATQDRIPYSMLFAKVKTIVK